MSSKNLYSLVERNRASLSRVQDNSYRVLPPYGRRYYVRGSYTNECKDNFANGVADMADDFVQCVFSRNTPYYVCKNEFDSGINRNVRKTTRCVRREENLGMDPYRE